MCIDLENIKFDKKGLVPVIAQDEKSGRVIMLAYANKEALEKTIKTGFANYWSRSRSELWLKGDTSGNRQKIVDILMDCDKDTVLYKVKQEGVGCHTGTFSCFERGEGLSNKDEEKEQEVAPKKEILVELYETIKKRKDNPKEGSYTNYLFDNGMDKILKKVGEETAEVIIAAKNQSKEELVYEISDLFYHISVLMADIGLNYTDIFDELERRKK